MSPKAKQFKELIIDPTLKSIGLYSPEASDLLLGTALVESNLDYLKQLGGGPALGYYQMEPATFDDLYNRYLKRGDKPELEFVVEMLMVRPHVRAPVTDPVYQLITNLPFATAIARIKYLMVPSPIPGDAEGQSRYWKEHYNTELGSGRVEDYMEKWNRYVVK